MGGKVKVSSEINVGTKFNIVLQLKVIDYIHIQEENLQLESILNNRHNKSYT